MYQDEMGRYITVETGGYTYMCDCITGTDLRVSFVNAFVRYRGKMVHSVSVALVRNLR